MTFDYPELAEYLRDRVKFDNATNDSHVNRIGTGDAQYIFNAAHLYRQSHSELTAGESFVVAWSIYWQLWEEK